MSGAVDDELTRARALFERTEADKGRLWRHLRDRCARAEEQRADALAVCDRIEAMAEAWEPPHQHGEAWMSVVRQIRAALVSS